MVFKPHYYILVVQIWEGEGAIFDAIREKWEDFLDWSDEKGLPVASAADWLESHGVPSLPVFALILLILLAGIAFVAFPLVSGPSTGDIKVTLADANDNPISEATVRIASTGDSAFAVKTQATDADGVVIFTGIPAGPVSVLATADGFADAEDHIEVVGGKQQEVQLSATVSIPKTVSVSLEISGPTDPDQISTILFDENWNPITAEQHGEKPTFTVDANTNFHARITAPGFSQQSISNQAVTESDKFLGSFQLKAEDTTKKGTVHVVVTDFDGKAVKGASVVVSERVSDGNGKELFTGKTGEDGSISPQDAVLGTLITAKVTAAGYSPKVSDAVTIVAETAITIEIRSLTGPQKLTVSLVDGDGKLVANGLLRLYARQPDGAMAVVDEKKPFKETVDFELEQNREYALSAYATGFLPQFFQKLEPGGKSITLVQATPAKSARLRVHVSNFDSADASGASVALFSADRLPLGLSEKTTGPDGVQYFDDVPLTKVIAMAASQGRFGESPVTVSSGNSSVEVLLPRGNGRVLLTVKDKFSLKPVKGAAVRVSAFEERACTTDDKGQCAVEATEFAGARAIASGAGYETLSTAQFDVRPGVDTKVEALLFPTSVTASTKLEFNGFYDTSGNKVTTLSPASVYRAKFTLRSPPIDYSQARAFVSVGELTATLEGSPVTITAYDAAGAQRVYTGTDFQLARQLNSAGDNTTFDAAAAASVPNAKEYKWVDFVFDKFSGGREISVTITTKASPSAKSALNYRTEFYTTDGVLRSPADAEAGKSKSELLAATDSAPIDLSFQGTCQDDLCVQAFLETLDGTRAQTGFQTPLGREFYLKFKAASFGTPFEAQLLTSGVAVGLLRGTSGGAETSPKPAPDGTLAVRMPASGGEGTFTLRGQRVSSDAYVKLTLYRGDAVAFEKTLFLRVNAEGTPTLSIIANPRTLVALAATPVVITVRDSLGVPVTGARVSLGGVGNDALGRIDEATEDVTLPGTYRIESVTAESAGVIAYAVDAAGFAIARGTISVNAHNLISVGETSLAVEVTAKGQETRTPITVTNLLDNEISVSLSVTRDGIPNLLDIGAEPSQAARMPSRGVLNAYLRAAIADYVLGLAAQGDTIKDSISGRVRVIGKLGAVRQAVEVPFTAKATLVRTAISDAWGIDASALNIELSPPDVAEKTVEVQVRNTGPHPLLINQQVNGLKGVFVNPPSQQVSPGATTAMQILARVSGASSSNQCVFDATTTKGTIRFFATFQGISSNKDLPVTLSLTAKGVCRPTAEQLLTMPIATRFELPADAKVRKNDDGSTTVQMSDGRRVRFSAGATVATTAVTVPPETEFYAEGTAATTATDGFKFTPPVGLILVLPAGVPVISRGDSSAAIIGTTQVLFPSTLAFSQDAGGRAVRVPPGTIVQITALPQVSLESNTLAILPAKIVFDFSRNAIVRENDDGSFSVESAGNAIGFSAQSQHAPQGSDGSVQVTVPSGTGVLFPTAVFSGRANNGFELRVPASLSIEIPSDVEVATRGTTIAAFLPDYDLLLPAGTTFKASAGGKTAAVGPNAIVSFKSVTGISLTGNAFANLPFALRLVLPGGARLDGSEVGKTATLASGETIGLPPDATVSDAQLDGTRVTTVPPYSQVSLPKSFFTPVTGGGFNLKPAVPYALGFPIGTRQVEAGNDLLMLLPDYDLRVPKNTRLAPDSGLLFTTQMAAGTQTRAAPAPEISVADLGRVTLPFDLTATLPAAARVNERSDGIAVLVRDGLTIGFSAPAELSHDNGSTINAPAGAAVLLPAYLIESTPDGSLRLTLPIDVSLSFDTGVQLQRGPAGNSFVSDDYKLDAGSATRVDVSKAGVLRAIVPAGTALTLTSTANAIAAGDEVSIPAQLSLQLPVDAIVRARADGRLYVEARGMRALFGAGATADAGKITVPENTQVIFSRGIVGQLRNAGLAQGRDFKLTIPIAYALAFPAGAGAPVATKRGTTAIAFRGLVIEFPPTAQSSSGDSGTLVSMTGGSATNFITWINGIPASELGGIIDAADAALTPRERLALAAKDNIAVTLPFQLELLVPPSFSMTTADDTGSGPAVWLSSRVAIAFGPTSQVAGSVPKTITAPAGTQLSLPASMLSRSPDGGYAITIPFSTAVLIPEDTEVVNDKQTYALLSNARQELALPAGTAFIQVQDLLRADLQPNTRIEVNPIGAAQLDGLVPVRLPVDAELLFASGVRAFTSGASTVVRLPDGSTAQFPGTIDAQTGPGGVRVLQWTGGTAAMLPRAAVTSDANGGTQFSLPIAANVILPPDARVVQRSGLVAVLAAQRAQITLPTSAKPASDKRGFIASVPAGGRISVSTFGLDVIGQPIVVPFEMHVNVPADAIVDENAPGGVVVEFSANSRAKFSGGVFTSPTGLGTGASLYGLQYGNGFFGSQLSPYGAGWQQNQNQFAQQVRLNLLTVPAFSQVTLAPSLMRPLGYSQGGLAGASAYEFSLPVMWTAIPQSTGAIYNNPDRSYSIFVQNNEIVFPAGTQSSPLSQFGGGLGAQQLIVPAFAPVRVLPVFNGASPFERRPLPFEMAMQLPQGARVLPRGQDGTRTIDFGGGRRMVLDRDLFVDERSVSGPTPPQLSELVITQGTLVGFSPGIYRPLPPQFANPMETASLPQNLWGFALQLPAAIKIRVPSDTRFAKNADGSQSAFVQNFEIRVPAGTSQPLTENGQNGVRTLAVAPNAQVLVVPLALSDSFERIELAVPFDVTFALSADARVLPKAADGSWAIEVPGRGSIAFRPESELAANKVNVPAGSGFFASRELAKADKSVDEFGTRATAFTFTAPMSMSIKSDTQPQGTGASRSLTSGTVELVLPAGVQSSKLGNAYVTIVSAGSQLVLRPIDASFGQNLQDIFLPGEAAFSLPTDAKAFGTSPAGEMPVKFASGQGIVFKGGSRVEGDGATRKVIVPNGASLAPSYALLKTASTTVRQQIQRTQTVPQGWRFATPSQLTVTLPAATRVETGDNGFLVQGQYESYLLPRNAQQSLGKDKALVFTLAPGMVIEYTPVDFNTGGLTEFVFPIAAALTLPLRTLEFADPGTSKVYYSLPSGEKVVLAAPAKKNAAGELVAQVEAGQVIFVPRGWKTDAPNGVVLKYGSRWSFAVPSGTKAEENGGEYLIRVPSTASPTERAGVYLPFPPAFSKNGVESGGRELKNPFALAAQATKASAGQKADGQSFVIVPAGTSVRFEATEKTAADVAGGPTGTLEITLDFDGAIQAADESTVNDKGGSVDVMNTACGNLQVDDTVFPKPGKRIVHTKTVQFQITNARADAESKRISFKAGAKLTIIACRQSEPEWRQVRLFFPVQTTFILPNDAPPLEGSGKVDFGACKEIRTSADVKMKPPRAEVIDFGSVPSPVKSSDKRGQQPDSLPTFTVPADYGILFTICKGDTKFNINTQGLAKAPVPNSIEVQVDGGASKDELHLVLDDGNRKANARIKMRNSGATVIEVNLDSTEADDKIKAAYNNEGEIWWGRTGGIGEGWVWETGYEKKAPVFRLSPTDDFRNVVSTDISLPRSSEFVNPLTGCVEKEAVIEGTLTFKGSLVTDKRPTQSNPLKVKIEIKKNPGACAAAQSLERVLRSGFYATHTAEIKVGDSFATPGKTLYFKTPDASHVQYFALINNLQEKATLSSKWTGTQVTDCSILKAGELVPIDALVMEKGEALVIKCTPKAGVTIPDGGDSGKQRLEIKATPKGTGSDTATQTTQSPVTTVTPTPTPNAAGQTQVQPTAPTAGGSSFFNTDEETKANTIRAVPVDTVAVIEFDVFNPEPLNKQFYLDAGTPLGSLCPFGQNAIDSSCNAALTTPANNFGSGASTGTQNGGTQANGGTNGQQNTQPTTPELGKCDGETAKVPIGTCYNEAHKADATKAGYVCTDAGNGRADYQMAPAQGKATKATNNVDLTRCCPAGGVNLNPSNDGKGCQNENTNPDNTVKAAAVSRINFQSAPSGTTGVSGATVTAPETTTGGSAAPTADTKDATAVNSVYYSLCEEFYCSSDQAQMAFKSHVMGYREIIDEARKESAGTTPDDKTQEVKVLNKLRERFKLGSTTSGFARAFVIQKAGDDKVTNAQIQKAALDAFPATTWHPKNVGVDGELGACGIYIVQTTFRFGPSAFSAASKAETALAESEITINIVKAADCPKNLANAPILMGPPVEKDGLTNTEIWTGRRVVKWPTDVDRITLLFDIGGRWAELQKETGGGVVGTALSVLSYPSVLALGPYGEEYNLKDAVIAKEAYRQMFGVEPAKVLAHKGVSYNDAGYCFQNGIRQVFDLSLASIGLSLGGLLGSFFSGGTSLSVTAVGVAIGKGAGQSIGACASLGASVAAGTVVTSGVGSQTVCEAFNACVYGQIFSLMTGFGGSKTPPASPSGFTAGVAQTGSAFKGGFGTAWKELTGFGLGSKAVAARFVPGMVVGGMVGLGGDGTQNLLPSYYLGKEKASQIRQSAVPDSQQLIKALRDEGVPASGAIPPTMVTDAQARAIFNKYDELVNGRAATATATAVAPRFPAGGAQAWKEATLDVFGTGFVSTVTLDKIALAGSKTPFGAQTNAYVKAVEEALKKAGTTEGKTAKVILGKWGPSIRVPGKELTDGVEALAQKVAEKIKEGKAEDIAVTEALNELRMGLDDSAVIESLDDAGKKSLESKATSAATSLEEAKTAATGIRSLTQEHNFEDEFNRIKRASTAAELQGIEDNLKGLSTSGTSSTYRTKLMNYIGDRKVALEGKPISEAKIAAESARFETRVNLYRGSGGTSEIQSEISRTIRRIEGLSSSGDAATLEGSIRADIDSFVSRLKGANNKAASAAEKAATKVTLENVLDDLILVKKDVLANQDGFRTAQAGLETKANAAEGTAETATRGKTSVRLPAATIDVTKVDELVTRIGTATDAELIQIETELRTTKLSAVSDAQRKVTKAITDRRAYLTTKAGLVGTSEFKTSFLKRLFGAGKSEADVISVVKKVKAPTAWRAALGQNFKELFLKKLPTGLLRLFLTLLFHVDVAPVQAALQSHTNSIVATNFEYVTRAGTNYIPSIHRYCDATTTGCDKEVVLDGNGDCSPQQGFAACGGFREKTGGGYAAAFVVNDRVESNNGGQINQKSETPAGTIDLGQVDDDTGKIKAEAASKEEQKAQESVGPQSKSLMSSVFNPAQPPLGKGFGLIGNLEKRSDETNGG
jgi:hypothetical protein